MKHVAPVLLLKFLFFLASAASAAVTINTTRPRLLDTTTIAEVSAKRTGSSAQQAQWTKLKNYVDGQLNPFCSGAACSLQYSVFRDAALIFAVDNTLIHARSGLTYGAAACATAVRYITEYGVNAYKSSNRQREQTDDIAFVYDLAHDACTAPQLVTMADYLVLCQQCHSGTGGGIVGCIGYVARTVASGVVGVLVGGNLYSGQVRTNLAIGIALFGDRTEAQAIADEAHTQYTTTIVHAQADTFASPRRGPLKGGWNPEGPEYAPQTAAY